MGIFINLKALFIKNTDKLACHSKAFPHLLLLVEGKVVFNLEAREIFIKIDKRKNTINVAYQKRNDNVKLELNSTPTPRIFHIIQTNQIRF